ncbi:hypothetical protein L0B53_18650 (plasmid) [Vibrio sp. SS-MA-C1-2]|uniref:hypothetical protein n=1 Tax=Vibrio sp. SS-MA-C1-2 TaxID=2908646 RepID=UPI001F209539|nr:hypothetical protein [Vibrio sp. SS-MA-C1-2]UJF20342.1 hypothetical protein L0B53_18650 [Vibrio sp. SS-MA-C1-2]
MKYLILLDADQYSIPVNLRDLCGREDVILIAAAARDIDPSTIEIDENFNCIQVPSKKEAADLALILEAQAKLINNDDITEIIAVTRDEKLSLLLERLAESFGKDFYAYRRTDWLMHVKQHYLGMNISRKKITKAAIRFLKDKPQGVEFHKIANKLSVDYSVMSDVLRSNAQHFARSGSKYYPIRH